MRPHPLLSVRRKVWQHTLVFLHFIQHCLTSLANDECAGSDHAIRTLIPCMAGQAEDNLFAGVRTLITCDLDQNMRQQLPFTDSPFA